MSQVIVNFRMDNVLKKKLEEVCKEMGMSISTAFNIFATKVARERRIPFAITADPFYSEPNVNFLKDALNDLDNGKGIEHDLIEVD